MKRLIFYLFVVVLGIAAFGWIATHKGGVVGARIAPEAPQAPAAPAETSFDLATVTPETLVLPGATRLPPEFYGPYASMTLSTLEPLAQKVVSNWDADTKVGKALSDDQVTQLKLALSALNDINTRPDHGAIVAIVAQLDDRLQRRSALAAAKALADDATGRKTYADQLEGQYLSQGMDVTVTVSGTKNTTITLRYVLMGRPTVYQLANDQEYLARLTDHGFKTVVFTDGYDSTWRFNLVKGAFF